MGAWGAGVFENDEALDWLGDLVEANDLGPIRAALAGAQGGGFLEADAAIAVLAAAEVVAALRGRPMADPPEQLGEVLAAGHVADDAELVPAALSAVRRVRERSELRELWDDVGSEDWVSALEDLEARLRALIPAKA
jgi:hypothetical protein